jgi:hypothetical protein
VSEANAFLISDAFSPGFVDPLDGRPVQSVPQANNHDYLACKPEGIP